MVLSGHLSSAKTAPGSRRRRLAGLSSGSARSAAAAIAAAAVFATQDGGRALSGAAPPDSPPKADYTYVFVLFVCYTALGSAATGYVLWRRVSEALAERRSQYRPIGGAAHEGGGRGSTLPRTASGIELEDVHSAGGGAPAQPQKRAGASPARPSPARHAEQGSSMPLRGLSGVGSRASYGSSAHSGDSGGDDL